MFTLRCTQRLRARLRLEQEQAAAREPSTRLGDWYANLLFVGRTQLVLCASERTLLPVLLPAREMKTLPERLPAALSTILLSLGVPAATVEAEVRAMSEFAVDETLNRRVVGRMTDFAYAIPFDLEAGLSLVETSLRLAETPCGPLGMASPDEVTCRLLQAAS